MLFGIDKSELRNITIESIDFEVLRRSSAVYNTSASDVSLPVKLHNSNRYITLDRLFIQDDQLFNTFTLDYKKESTGARSYYTILDLAIKPKRARQHNLIPMSANKYRQKLIIIREYLIHNYGLYVSFNESRIKKIEVNITAKMDHSFESYKMLFEAIRQERNLRVYPYFVPFEKGLAYNTYYFYSKVQHLKFYNKAKELHDSFKIEVDDELMRLEYTLIGFDKIKSKLGTDSPLDLTDEAIADFLNESIKEDVFKPVEKYIDKTDKQLAKKYKQIKKQYKRGFIREFAHYCNAKDTDIFDIQQVLDIAKRDINKNHNGSRNKKLIDSIMSQSLKNNLDKFAEFKVKFQIVNQ